MYICVGITPQRVRCTSVSELHHSASDVHLCRNYTTARQMCICVGITPQRVRCASVSELHRSVSDTHLCRNHTAACLTHICAAPGVKFGQIRPKSGLNSSKFGQRCSMPDNTSVSDSHHSVSGCASVSESCCSVSRCASAAPGGNWWELAKLGLIWRGVKFGRFSVILPYLPLPPRGSIWG